MPTNVVRTAEQERFWNKAKKLATKQGRANDYAYIMGIYKQMSGMDKSLEQESNMKKSYMIPAQTLNHARVPGQVPSKDAMEAMKLAKEKPQPFSIARLMDHDEPILTTRAIVDNVGFDVVQQNDWAKFLESAVSNASNEVVLRQDIMSKCLNERVNGSLRQVILQRSLNYWKKYRKSMIQMTTADELLKKAEARGGSYHRRVPRPKGGYTYYYDEEKYRNSKQAHTNGQESQHIYISGKVHKCIEAAGKKGCGPDAFRDLVKKYGAKAVSNVIRNDVANSKYTFQKGIFVLQGTGEKVASDKPDDKKVAKSEFFIIPQNPGCEHLEKSGPHKYISRKKDAKGNWIYTYPEDKKKRIVDMILDFLSNPKRKLTVSNTARSFRIDKGMAGQILRDLESKGKIQKDGNQFSIQSKEKQVTVDEKLKEESLKAEKPTKIAMATVEKEVTEEQAEKEENVNELAAGIVGGVKVRALKERGLKVVRKKRSGENSEAEWEAIGILSGEKFLRLVDRGLTVEWAKGAIPKAEPPKNEKRKDKTTSDRLEQTGEHIWGSRKDLAGIGKITDSKQLEGMSYDDAAYIVRKSRLVPVHNLEMLKAMNMTPGTAHMTVALLASIKSKPGDSATERAAYVDEIREVTGGIENVKTVTDFNNFLNELSATRKESPQWEIVETADNKDAARDRIAELEKDNPGVQYGTRFNYQNYKTEIAQKMAKPYDALGTRFTKFADRSGKFYDSALREAMTVDNLWTYKKVAEVEDGWAYLEASDAEKKAAKKKKAEKTKTKRGETKRGWSGAKEIAGEVIREGGNIDVKEADAERVRDTFNFKEVDYGKKAYMTQADREYHTKAFEEAMYDFSEILGTTPDTLSFNGRLGVAMGARGRGKASAHYESIRKVINITKFRGGGTVAHEWGHALDNIIASHFVKTGRGSSKGDAFLSESPKHSAIPSEISKAMVEVMDVIKKHPDPEKARKEHNKYVNDLSKQADKLVSQNNILVEEHKQLKNKPKSREVANKRIARMESSIDEWQAYIDKEKPKIKDRKDKGQKVSFDRELEVAHRESWIKNYKNQISDLKKPISVQSKEDEARMNQIESEIEDLRLPINRARTKLNNGAKMDPTVSDYYKSATLLGKNYWGNNQELFARAFESYVQDELASNNRRNTYLVDGTTVDYDTGIPVSTTGTVQPYPKGEERKRINASMKKLVDVIRETKSLEKSLQRFYIRK
jgi:hypothetical protein